MVNGFRGASRVIVGMGIAETSKEVRSRPLERDEMLVKRAGFGESISQ